MLFRQHDDGGGELPTGMQDCSQVIIKEDHRYPSVNDPSLIRASTIFVTHHPMRIGVTERWDGKNQWPYNKYRGVRSRVVVALDTKTSSMIRD